MNRLLDELIQYVKEQPGFDQLLAAFRQKYESLGRVGGSVSIATYEDEEVEHIALFMGMFPHHLRQKNKVDLQAFERRLGATKFAGITLLELLCQYFGTEIVSKREQRQRLHNLSTKRIEKWKRQYEHIDFWFQHLAGHPPDTQWIWRLIHQGELEEEVALVARAWANLPVDFERLPLFSQKVSGNPHTFDMTTTMGKLWLHVLHVAAGGEGPVPMQTEAVNELLLSYRLLRDDITNYVSVANVTAFAENGKEHPVWKAARQSSFVLNMPLRELLRVKYVGLVSNDDIDASAQTNRIGERNKDTVVDDRDNMLRTETSDTKSNVANTVYIVENSGVFSALLDLVPTAPLICTHGQFKLAGLLLLDRLTEAGYQLRYSGDFDPEGIGMAIRLKVRYGNQVELWRMSVDDYIASTPTTPLNERIKKLAALKGAGYDELVEAVEREGLAGYQEGILGRLVKDLSDRS